MSRTGNNSGKLQARRLILTIWMLIVLLGAVGGFSTRTPNGIVVSGAGSGVGKIVMRKLLKQEAKLHKYKPIGLVENQAEANELVAELGASRDSVAVVDLTDKAAVRMVFETQEDSGMRISKVVMCTSAKPRRKLQARVRDALASLNVFKRNRSSSKAMKPDDLYYKEGRDPYHIDFLAQKHLIDAAKKAEVKHIVMLGSMGGYGRNNNLDKIGRKPGETNSKRGNLLKWKRKAERYLMKRNFFTIVHAGPLTDESGGQTEIVWDTDDALLRTNFKKISKEDCAEVLVQALVWKEAIGRSIDVGSRPLAPDQREKKYRQDWLRFWSMPGNNIYPAGEPTLE